MALNQPQIRLIPRHSVLNANQFTVFESDLDCTLIIPTDFSEADLAKAKAIYEETRRRRPFLGELEIYKSWEHAMREQLLREFHAELQFVARLRKWSWLKASYEQAGSRYHRRKALRSLFKIQQLLGVQLEHPLPQAGDGRMMMTAARQVFSGLFVRLDLPAQFEFKQLHSEFLEWWILNGERISESDPVEFCLTGTIDECAVLLALCPDATFLDPLLEKTLADLRAEPKMRDTFLAICIYEYLMLQSVARTASFDQNPNLQDWARAIYQLISKYRSSPLADELMQRCAIAGAIV